MFNGICTEFLKFVTHSKFGYSFFIYFFANNVPTYLDLMLYVVRATKMFIYKNEMQFEHATIFTSDGSK